MEWLGCMHGLWCSGMTEKRGSFTRCPVCAKRPVLGILSIEDGAPYGGDWGFPAAGGNHSGGTPWFPATGGQLALLQFLGPNRWQVAQAHVLEFDSRKSIGERPANGRAAQHSLWRLGAFGLC